MPEETNKYQKEWENWRRRNLFFWSSFFGVLLVGLLETYVAEHLPETARKAVVCLMFLSWTTVIIALVRFQMWDCPRCKEPYFHIFKKVNVRADFKCRHCGLPKYEGSSFKKNKRDILGF